MSFMYLLLFSFVFVLLLSEGNYANIIVDGQAFYRHGFDKALRIIPLIGKL